MNAIHKFIRVVIAVLSMTILSTLVTGCGKMKLSRHQQRGDDYFAAGDFSKAEVEYLIVRRYDNMNSHAIARLGLIYYEQGCPNRAYPFIAKACELYTNDVDLYIKLGTIHLQAGNSKEAREAAGLVLEKSPTNAEAPVLLAESVTSLAERDQVQKRLQSLAKQIGDTAPVEVALGSLDFRSNNPKDAEAAFKRALSLNTNFSTAYFALGNLYVTQNKTNQAEEALKTAASLAKARSPERLSYAAFKIRNGDLAAGRQLLEEITKVAPDYVPAWTDQAQIALSEKRFKDCGMLIDRALAHDPNNYEALLIQGRLLMMQQHSEQAAVVLERMAALYDRSAPVQFYLALAHLVSGDTSKAISSLNQALIIDPNYAEAVITLAQLNIRRGDSASAAASLTQLLRRQPRLVPAQMLLAQAYLRQNDPNDALVVYGRLEDLLPKDPTIPVLVGSVLAQEGKLAEARKSYERALEFAPHFPEAVEQLVDLDITEKQYSNALALVKSELKGETNEVTSQLLMAKIHMSSATDAAKKMRPDSDQPPFANVPSARQDVDQAEAELLRVIDLKPDFIGPYVMLAQLYVAAGKEQEALNRLTELTKKTNSAPVYMEIGNIYDALTNYPAARDAYEKVLSINPNFTPAMNDLAYLYSESLGEPDKAYPLAEKARQLHPDDPATADTLGWILYKRGDYAGAVSLLDESAAKLPTDPEIQFHLGSTHYMLGEEDAARADLERAAKSSKSFAGKPEVSRRLAILAIDVKTADAKTVSDLEKLSRDNPGDPIVASRLAAIYERDGALEKAVTAYERVLKGNPRNSQVMGHLAQLYLRLNDNNKALEIAKQAHTLAPDDPVISWTLGRMVFRSGDYPWALSLLQQAAEKLPNRPDVLYDLAWAHYSVGNIAEAESAMDKSLSALSGATLDDAKRFLSLVRAARTPAAAQGAVPQAAQTLATNANYVPAIVVLAFQKEQQGAYKEAETLYKKALACYPVFSPAGRDLAVLCAKHPGDDQKAYAVGLKARAAYPDDANLSGALGILAYRQGDYSQAAQLLKQSIDAPNNDGELLYYLGKADYQLKHREESKEALQRALNLNLQSDMAADAQKLLAELKQK